MKVFVAAFLLFCAVFPFNLLADSEGTQGPKGEPDCEASVDAADDMNFVDNIIDCDDEAVVLYDERSRQQFMSRKAIALTRFDRQQRDGSSSVMMAAPVHLPGTRFIIRSSYRLSSPQDAWVSLHQQMAAYCPLGWQLDRQWSTPNAADYYLHYEFTCAD